MKHICRVFLSSSHSNTNFVRQFSLPFYSFVNIIRVSFSDVLWKIHQGVRENKKKNSFGVFFSKPDDFQWPVKYHHSISQNTSLRNLFLFLRCCYKDIIFIIAFVIKIKLFFQAHKQQHHINYPIYSADFRKKKIFHANRRKFINLKEAIDCWLPLLNCIQLFLHKTKTSFWGWIYHSVIYSSE
jgi:hypothetical protein